MSVSVVASRGEESIGMAVLIFAISVLSVLTTVGILFALMVRLASVPGNFGELQEQAVQLADRKRH